MKKPIEVNKGYDLKKGRGKIPGEGVRITVKPAFVPTKHTSTFAYQVLKKKAEARIEVTMQSTFGFQDSRLPKHIELESVKHAEALVDALQLYIAQKTKPKRQAIIRTHERTKFKVEIVENGVVIAERVMLTIEGAQQATASYKVPATNVFTIVKYVNR